jgi:hypothetical protein
MTPEIIAAIIAATVGIAGDRPLAQWLLYGEHTPIRDFYTNDLNLRVAEYTYGAVAFGAFVIATGGFILEPAPIFGIGVGTFGTSATAAVPAATAIATNPTVQQELQQLETLAPELENTLQSELPTLSNLEQQLAQNYSRGNAFQTAVTKAFELTRNTTTRIGQTASGAVRTIHDVYAGAGTPFGDVKDVLRLSFTRQLQAQSDIAGQHRMAGLSNTSFNIITSFRNLSITGSLADAVRLSGGFIFRVDSSGRTVDVWDAAAEAWVPFLGGNWGF